MKDLSETHVAIIGLGLMGGSLAAALYGCCRKTTGIDQDTSTLQYAMQKGWIDEGTTDLETGLKEAEVIILATPVRTILNILAEIGNIVRRECMVLDLGSTKREIVSVMERLPRSIHSIGGHPMCGREVSGIQQADPDLFIKQPFLLVPHNNTRDETLSFAQEIVTVIGSHALIMDPKKHDQIVSAVSHLPYLLASGLVAAAESVTQEGSPIVWDVAASGFRDTSRLAASNITMMIDILLTNRKAILNSVNLFKHQLDRLENLIAAEEEDLLRENLEKIYERRSKLFL